MRQDLSDLRIPIEYEIGAMDILGEFWRTSQLNFYDAIAVATYVENSSVRFTIFPKTKIPVMTIAESRQFREERDRQLVLENYQLGERSRQRNRQRDALRVEERKRDERKSQSAEQWQQLPERTHRLMSGEEVETFARQSGSRYLTTSGFTYPENWTTTSIPFDVLEEEYNNLLNGAQCFDVISLDESKFKEYLDQDPEDNIILIAPSNTGKLGSSALCYSRSVLKETLRDLTAMSLPCVGANGDFPADASQRFIRLSLPNMNIFVPEVELIPIAAGTMKWKMYQVESSGFTIPRTMSGDSGLFLNFVSGDHCNAGTEKLVYHLRPIVAL